MINDGKQAPGDLPRKATVMVRDAAGSPTSFSALPFWLRPASALVKGLAVGALDVTLPDGTTILVQSSRPGPSGHLVIRRWRAVRRIMLHGDLGLGEAFMAGEWESTDPTAVLELFSANALANGTSYQSSPVLRALQGVGRLMSSNTRRGAKRNIAAHYDLGNDFYSHWLDPTMTYSSAYFASGANDLESAQREKYRALIAKTGITADDHVLEVGCGWGGFACFAAEEVGCKVTALTISKAQHDYAVERVRAAGLTERVSIVLRDYRDERGQYDKVVSIEMFEAVGERYWPDYFRMLGQRLKRGGAAGLQIITIDDRHFDDYRRGTDFIQRYIFPGGLLPPMSRLQRLTTGFGLASKHVGSFGGDYARTLAVWRDRFEGAWPDIEGLGFDERFRKMWLFYLHFCEAGFRAGLIDVRQMVLEKQ